MFRATARSGLLSISSSAINENHLGADVAVRCIACPECSRAGRLLLQQAARHHRSALVSLLTLVDELITFIDKFWHRVAARQRCGGRRPAASPVTPILCLLTWRYLLSVARWKSNVTRNPYLSRETCSIYYCTLSREIWRAYGLKCTHGAERRAATQRAPHVHVDYVQRHTYTFLRLCDTSTRMRTGIMHVSGEYYERTSTWHGLGRFTKHIKCSRNNTLIV